jgi:hypothetical protein
MKFICAQPAIDYYAWQVEVMLDNFIENQVNPEDIHIVSAIYGAVPEKWNKLKGKYPKVGFFFYNDERFKPGYIPSVRPHVLHKHWVHHPELEKETVFYHDCDIILAKPFDTEGLMDNNICYVSDTVSYLGANYIKSKGEHYFDLMTSIVGVNKDYVVQQEKNSGGAQYILKNIKTEFWKKVYYDCEVMYRMVNQQIKKDPPHHEIQIWCADMWAVLWNLFVYDKPVEVTEKLSFSWATSPISEWSKHAIFHNAGVTKPGDMFYKGQYIGKLPYDNIDLSSFKTTLCSYKYAEQVAKTSKTSCLI